MSEATPPAYVCVGAIVIDDIVLPQGASHMDVLGGSVSHSAAGVAAWDQRPGVVASMGRDFPQAASRRLARDFDLRGVITLDLPQVRAWQLFEWDGRRTEIFRVDEVEPFLTLPAAGEVPPAYRGARGIHLMRPADGLPTWRATFSRAVLLWEPPQPFMVAAHADAFRAALPGVDIVSPNWLEAQQVYGFDDPGRLAAAMIDDGASLAVLRMGDQGSCVASRDGDAIVRVPPVPVPQVVDQTGAGNAFCGAFLVGWGETGDVLQAACYGAVAASFAIELIGVMDSLDSLRAERDRRLTWIQTRLGVVGHGG
jgi:sugar/nucleoside kinase (ribokinase family)